MGHFYQTKILGILIWKQKITYGHQQCSRVDAINANFFIPSEYKGILSAFVTTMMINMQLSQYLENLKRIFSQIFTGASDCK